QRRLKKGVPIQAEATWYTDGSKTSEDAGIVGTKQGIHFPSDNKKEAEKLIKNIIKIVIKLGVLHRNNMFTEEELKLAEKFKTKFRLAGMAIISFYEVDFSYDRNYIVQAFTESQKCLETIVSKHLTDKSLSRIDSVFSFFGNDQFLDSVFKSNSEYREALGRVVADLNQAIDNGDL
ncbi:tumor necrosis factor alpha-induced protein 8-like protein, partial [Diabrotica undecimpunctata]|uniref:tumor necrosis factor alpha-induced protein 8-like protein n=1 Tax=Diabrotica undecimpunctata TaxID=50387 RepID=UPI003B638BA6